MALIGAALVSDGGRGVEGDPEAEAVARPAAQPDQGEPGGGHRHGLRDGRPVEGVRRRSPQEGHLRVLQVTDDERNFAGPTGLSRR